MSVDIRRGSPTYGQWMGDELLLARPKYNGGVERGNRTFREEFYACRDLIADSIGAMRFKLRKAAKKYNAFRPHHALKGKTPMEYLRTNHANVA